MTLIQGNSNSCCRGVPVAVQIHLEFRKRDAQTLRQRFDNPQIGLMRNDTGEVVNRQTALLGAPCWPAESIEVTACLNVSRPFMCTVFTRSSIFALVTGRAHPPPGICKMSPKLPSLPIKVVITPCEPARHRRIAAPAPSPKRTQVLRSFQLTIELSLSAPIDQDRVVGMVADELLGHFDCVEETGAGRGNIEARRVHRAQQSLNVTGGGREKRVRGDGRNDDQIDLRGSDTPPGPWRSQLLGRPCGWCARPRRRSGVP